MRLSAFRALILAGLACGSVCGPASGPAGAQGRPRAPAPDTVPPNPFASNYPSRPPEAARPRPRRDRAGEGLRPPRDIPLR